MHTDMKIRVYLCASVVKSVNLMALGEGLVIIKVSVGRAKD